MLTMNVLTVFLLAVAASTVRSVIIERTEEMFGEDFVVSWIADTEEETIEFTVTAKTTGWVGFGISPNGNMTGADLVMGGIDAQGKAYFEDRYSKGHGLPAVDVQQDWTLINANETETHTTLTFNRSFVTCDLETDISIEQDFTYFIWAWGASDNLTKHAQRGFHSVYILDPPSPEVEVSAFEPWNIFVETTIPTADTSYWCTVHKTPEHFVEKRHIVGFEVLLNSTEALTHTHHMVLHHCPYAPGSPEGLLLEAALNTTGGECYEFYGIPELVQLCNTYFYVWAKGGKPLFTPENVGIPLNGKNVSEYFILEIHYDNPEVLPEVSYVAGVQIYTTTDNRPVDGGLLPIYRSTGVDLMIPPNAGDYIVNAHCSPECTELAVPAGGVKVYNVLLHSHLAGRKIKLRQFRDGNEIPWVLNDDHYNFDFQQNRPLTSERELLPKDQLAVECIYDTTGYSKPTWGGLSTRHEMCEAFLMYYPKIDLEACGSAVIDWDTLVTNYGIEEFCGETDIVCKPEALAGFTYTEVLETKVNWTQTLMDKVEQESFSKPHYANCPPVGLRGHMHGSLEKTFNRLRKMQAMPKDLQLITYPEGYKPYIPANPEEACGGYASTTELPSSTQGASSSVASFTHFVLAFAFTFYMTW